MGRWWAAAKSFDVGTPPAMVQSRPVPAQAMQDEEVTAVDAVVGGLRFGCGLSAD